MPSPYTYIAIDTLTGRQIDELPLTGVKYGYAINDAATATATLPLAGRSGPDTVLAAAHTSILIDKGGSLRWGGVLWGRKYNKRNRSLDLTFGDNLTYFDHLLITDTLSFADTEQLAIFRSLVNYGQAKDGANFAAGYRGAAVTGQLRDRTYNAADLGYVGARLRDLANVEGGFDFRATVQWENGYARRIFQLGYPTLGRAWPASSIVFDDSDLDDWTMDEDGSASASTWYATGALPEGSADGAVAPAYTADDPSIRAAGYPRLESGVSFTDITDTATLALHARGKLLASRLPIKQFTLSVPESDNAPQIGTYLPGDQALFRIAPGDDYFPAGAEVIGTITTVDITVNDADGSDTADIGLSPITITEGGT